MNVKKILMCTLLLGTFVGYLSADSADSARIADLERSQLLEVEARGALVTKVDSLSRVLSTTQKQVERLSVSCRQSELRQDAKIDTLYQSTKENELNIRSAAEKLGVEISSTNSLLGGKADSADVQQRTWIGIVIVLLLAILSLVIYLMLRSRILKGSADIEALHKKAEELNEQIVDKLAAEMSEMQKISESLSILSTSGSASSEPDHSLILTLADRITFMEMTLSKMDESVRGYRQLSRSIEQMKNNMLANGYQIVDMLGKPYNDGMKVTATFMEDASLPEGTQKITGITKPQVNYKGVMIQAAQITVSQNI